LITQGKLLAKVNRNLGCFRLGGRSLATLFLLGADLLELKPLNGVLDVAHVTLGRLEVLATALTRNFEAKNFGLVVVDLGGQNHRHRVVHEEDLGEAGAE